MSAKTEDLMAPEASPGDAPKKAGVRRVNNMPLYLMGSVVLGFLVIMLLVAGDRAKQQEIAANSPAEQEKKSGGSTFKLAEGIVAGQESGVVPASDPDLHPADSGASSAAPAGSSESSPGNTRSSTGELSSGKGANGDLDQPPTRSDSDRKVNEVEERVRQMKAQQFEQAVVAKTSVQFSMPKSQARSGSAGSGAPATRQEALARIADVQKQIDAQTGGTDPLAAYQARLQQAKAMAGASGGGSGSGGMTRASADESAPAGIDQFDNKGEGDRWRLNSKMEAPPTPYTLRTGFVIPGKLISGINSDLPGEISAQIDQDVYDTPRGKYLLLPQGSRLNGKYSAEVVYGQSRVLIAWTRIIFPDGKALDIGAMPGADSAGYAGFSDQVNNHLWRLYSSAFLLSGITAGVALSQPENNSINSRPTASSAMSEALGQQLGQVSAQLIQKNMNIAPTLEIRPGYRFNIIVTKDMVFTKPYKQFDY